MPNGNNRTLLTIAGLASAAALGFFFLRGGSQVKLGATQFELVGVGAQYILEEVDMSASLAPAPAGVVRGSDGADLGSSANVIVSTTVRNEGNVTLNLVVQLTYFLEGAGVRDDIRAITLNPGGQSSHVINVQVQETDGLGTITALLQLLDEDTGEEYDSIGSGVLGEITETVQFKLGATQFELVAIGAGSGIIDQDGEDLGSAVSINAQTSARNESDSPEDFFVVLVAHIDGVPIRNTPFGPFTLQAAEELPINLSVDVFVEDGPGNIQGEVVLLDAETATQRFDAILSKVLGAITETVQATLNDTGFSLE